MSDDQFRAWNHYLPRMYLKRFASEPGMIWRHRLLVSNAGVRPWDHIPISQAAAYEYLYSHSDDQRLLDDTEEWLAKEFETRDTDEILERAATGQRISKKQWPYLIRFFAAQDVRTPARYFQNLERWKTSIPPVLEKVGSLFARIGDPFPYLSSEVKRLFPIKTTISSRSGESSTKLHIEFAAGRKMWMFQMRVMLRPNGPIQHLLEQRWTVLKLPHSHPLFTTDQPVLKIGRNPDGTQHSGGGWGSEGTVLLMPLSPSRVLYCTVGSRAPGYGEELHKHEAEALRSHFATHAFRNIYSHAPADGILALRPRSIDPAQYRMEQQLWRTWNSDQTSSERFERPSDD